jgi:hypothetical protein
MRADITSSARICASFFWFYDIENDVYLRESTQFEARRCVICVTQKSEAAM